MEQVKARALSKTFVAPGITKLRLFAPQIAKAAVPGQFVHVRCGEDRDFILRRPFSIHQVTGPDSIEILFNVVGSGTRWLSNLAIKDSVDILGPLGKGFDLAGDSERATLVAGGMGIAPLVFLATKLVEAHVKVSIVMGAATREQLLDYMDLKRLSFRVTVATEDGSQGTKGLVTDVLNAAIANDKPTIIYSCGPKAMLKEVSRIAEEADIRCQVALEELMACGVGVCLSCVTETIGGYKKVCSSGPVFDSSEIAWDADRGSQAQGR